MGKNTKNWAVVFGIFYIALGVLGFIPGCCPMGMLFGAFEVNGAHNFLHLITGIAGLWTGIVSKQAAKTFFKVFGIVYVILALLGFLNAERHMVLGMFMNNMGDSWLHLVTGLIGLFFGYSKKK